MAIGDIGENGQLARLLVEKECGKESGSVTTHVLKERESIDPKMEAAVKKRSNVKLLLLALRIKVRLEGLVLILYIGCGLKCLDIFANSYSIIYCS